MACGDPGSTKCAGTWTASTAGVMAPSVSFIEPLVAGDQKASLASLSLQLCPFRHLEGILPGVLLCCSACQAHRGAPLDGVLLCRLVCQALKGAPLVGSYSVVQWVRFLMGQPLYSEKAMAPHSSNLAWKIPWTEDPGRLQSMGSRRVGHD